MTYARVVEDSISPEGVRLTTIEGRFNRFVLSEANTHRVLSKNSASSRAIPLAKQITKIKDDLAYPVVFPAEQKGMQGGAEIEDPERAREEWAYAAHNAVEVAEALAELGVHKSVSNRLLEPFMWHTVVFTATAWDNFFLQRCSPLAQPEIRVFAEAAEKTMAESTPKILRPGEWHLPYVTEEDWEAVRREEYKDVQNLGKSMYPTMTKISSARCAGVSYMTQGGKRDYKIDLKIYEKLTTAQPPHWSPLEHVATPWPQNRQVRAGKDVADRMGFNSVEGAYLEATTNHLPRVGNLLAWRSLRTEVEAAQGLRTFR